MQTFVRKHAIVVLSTLLIPLTACAAGHGKNPPHNNGGDVKFSVDFKRDGSVAFRDRNGRPLDPRPVQFPLEVNSIEGFQTIVDVKRNPCWAIYYDPVSGPRLVEYC